MLGVYAAAVAWPRPTVGQRGKELCEAEKVIGVVLDTGQAI